VLLDSFLGSGFRHQLHLTTYLPSFLRGVQIPVQDKDRKSIKYGYLDGTARGCW
jgi:hypothetical protein